PPAAAPPYRRRPRRSRRSRPRTTSSDAAAARWSRATRSGSDAAQSDDAQSRDALEQSDATKGAAPRQLRGVSPLATPPLEVDPRLQARHDEDGQPDQLLVLGVAGEAVAWDVDVLWLAGAPRGQRGRDEDERLQPRADLEVVGEPHPDRDLGGDVDVC